MKVELLQITENPEKLIELAGRTCYDSSDKITDESSSKFIKMLINSGHESVLEHASATFRISGVSRALTHQLVRHRLASYSQRSQRYCKEDGFDYVTPPDIEKSEASNTQYDMMMGQINKFYKELLSMGLKPEDCRFVLPNACCTEIVMTANFREWRHVLKERLSKKAQWEIREMAEKIFNILYENAPNVFADLGG